MTKQENKEKGFTTLTPQEGKYLTDGATVSTLVYTPTDKADRWTEVSAEEAEAIREKAQEQETQETEEQ